MALWMAASSTKADRPKPSAVTSWPVGAPGRCRFAFAVRSSGLRGLGRRAASLRMIQPSSASRPSNTAAPPRKPALSKGCGAPTSASATIPASPPTTHGAPSFQRCDSGLTRARISAMAGNRRAASRGGAANTSATSSPKPAARSRANGSMAKPLPVGSRSASARARNGVTAIPTTSPATLPISAAAPICRA